MKKITKCQQQNLWENLKFRRFLDGNYPELVRDFTRFLMGERQTKELSDKYLEFKQQDSK